MIEIICDGGPKMGFGHVRRSSSIAWALKQHGFSVCVRILSEPGKAIGTDVPNDKGHAQLVVVDLPYDMTPFFKKAHAEKKTTVGIEYYDDQEPPCQTISVFEHKHPLPRGNRVSGLQYAMIRPEILHFREKAKQGESVLVMMGGTDALGLGDTAAQCLLALGLHVTLIEGPLMKGRYHHMKSNQLNVLHNPSNLPELMANCSWAITNGGVSMLEMMCLGKAIFVIPQSHYEQIFSESILQKNGILGIGLEAIAPPTDEKKVTHKDIAQALVDGQGPQRIVKIIQQLLKNVPT